MPVLCSFYNSAYYANNYAGIFDAGLHTTHTHTCKSIFTIKVFFVVYIFHAYMHDNYQWKFVQIKCLGTHKLSLAITHCMQACMSLLVTLNYSIT